MGSIILNASKVNHIHTNSIQSPSFSMQSNGTFNSLRQADEIIMHNVIAATRISVPDDLMLAASISHMKNTSLCNQQYDKLNVSESIIAGFLNGRPFNELLTKKSNLTLKLFEVDSLIVPNSKKINEKSGKKEKRQIPSKFSVDTVLRVDELFVSGRLNGIEFSDLLENVLRTNAIEQKIGASINIDILSSRSVQIPSNIISDQNLSGLISIRDNQTIIDQHIRFMKSLSVNDLRIIERLNQINIHNEVLDVLFKRKKAVQTITGSKLFQSIKLLEPIFQSGKIQINSPNLNKIKPIVTIEEDLILTGDYSISGNVTIRNGMIAKNLFGRSGRFSVDSLLTDGLRIDETNINIPIEFSQSIQIENVGQGTHINDVSVDNLIKRNVIDVQKVTSTKIFHNDLYVENGIGDAFTINFINLDKLNKTVLKTNADNQILNGSIHFRRISAEM